MAKVESPSDSESEEDTKTKKKEKKEENKKLAGPPLTIGKKSASVVH